MISIKLPISAWEEVLTLLDQLRDNLNYIYRKAPHIIPSAKKEIDYLMDKVEEQIYQK